MKARRDFLKLQVQKHLNNSKIDVASLITDLVSSEKERYVFAAKISESNIQLAHILNVSSRTAQRGLKDFNISVKHHEKNKS